MSIPWVPIREFVPGWTFAVDPIPVWTGMVDGREAWTEGHVLLTGKPPQHAFGVVGEKDFAPVLKKALRPGLERISPVAVAELNVHVVIFSNGVLVDFKFYMLVRRIFPKCQWWADEQSCHDPGNPVILRDGDTLLGLISGIRADDYAQEISEILNGVRGPGAG